MEIHMVNVSRIQRKDNGLEIMYVETGQVQGREAEQELWLNTLRRESYERAAYLQTHSMHI